MPTARRSDAAFLVFGGLTTSHIAALADGADADAVAAAAAADAIEADASRVALNDLLLLTRGARGAWGLTRLAPPDEIACSAHPTFLRRVKKASDLSSAFMRVETQRI